MAFFSTTVSSQISMLSWLDSITTAPIGQSFVSAVFMDFHQREDWPSTHHFAVNMTLLQSKRLHLVLKYVFSTISNLQCLRLQYTLTQKLFVPSKLHVNVTRLRPVQPSWKTRYHVHLVLCWLIELQTQAYTRFKEDQIVFPSSSIEFDQKLNYSHKESRVIDSL